VQNSQTCADSSALNYQWVIFGILAVSHMLMAMCFYSWGPMAPYIKAETGISNSQFGLIFSIMFFSMVVVAAPSGILTDKIGAKWMFFLSASLMGFSFLILSFFRSYGMILFVSFLAGSGYGMINQITTKGFMYWFDQSKRATVMGIKQTGVTIGGSLIGLFIPFFSLKIGLSGAILLLALLILSMVLVALFLYKEKPDNYVEKIADASDKKGFSAIKELLLQPKMIILTVILSFFAICQGCLTSFLVIFAEESFQLTKFIAGSLLTVAMIGGTFSRIFFGFLSDRVFKGDRVAPLAILALIGGISCFSLVFLKGVPPLWILYVFAAFLGIALMGWNGLGMILVAEMAGSEMVGSVMGILFVIPWSSMAIGPPVFGYIIDTSGYQLAWLMNALFCLITFIGLCFIWKMLKK